MEEVISEGGAEKADKKAGQNEAEKTKEVEETKTEASDEIYVYICGAVKKPGVYKLKAQVRLYEAVEQAGGLSKEASETWLNQAEELKDGQKIEVLTKAEAKKLKKASQAAQGEDSVGGGGKSAGKVNLNTATKEELMTLSGIGEAKAAAIIAYREENGGFARIEDIKKIEGIKDGVFKKVEAMITVNE